MLNRNKTQRELQIQEDVCLADELRPPSNTSTNESTGVALVTGGTGFLGRYIIRELLSNTTKQLVCLVRADTQELAQRRIVDALQSICVTKAQIKNRVQIIAGDIESERFGLDETHYKSLSARVDEIYHNAATVNWVRSYVSLRSTNVLGTLEVIRFACDTRAKSILFVSSIAVCYASSLRGRIDESTNIWPHINNMPLGYAQSKCVAESLLIKMQLRGLPISIVRPALISGDSQTGQSATGDLTTAVIEGCVLSGVASDVDWAMDHVPVDYVAKVIAEMPIAKKSGPPGGILHIQHNQPRQWREVVLMLNLYGYPIKLIPMGQWLKDVFTDRTQRGSRLYGYRHFFLQQLHEDNNRPIYELYLNPLECQLFSQNSHNWLAKRGLRPPESDAYSLRRVLQFWQKENVLPALPRQSTQALMPVDIAAQLKALVQCHIRATDANILVIESMPLNVSDSILGELSAIKSNLHSGVSAWRIHLQDGESDSQRHFDCVMKLRANDDLLIDACVNIATLCGTRLSNQVDKFKFALGLQGCQTREQALYALRIPSLRQHTPRTLGTICNDDSDYSALVLERVNDIAVRPKPVGLASWSMADIDCALDGLARIQSIPVNAIVSSLPEGLLEPTQTLAQTRKMLPLWHELVSFSAQFTKQWSPSLAELQHHLLDTLIHWRTSDDTEPKVLVHNDFNPRNLMLRQTSQGRRLCVFDWELAVIGSAQQDLAEFLCFTTNPETLSESILRDIVGRHRQRLVSHGLAISKEATWNAGFAIALRQFMITRLPWYSLMHRFRPQRHLELCSRNASVLFALTHSWLPSANEYEPEFAANDVTNLVSQTRKRAVG